MRLTIQLAAGVMAAALTANAQAVDTSPAQPQSGVAWCGFHEKAGAQVRCGFSSEAQCRQALGSKDTVCIVDPFRT